MNRAIKNKRSNSDCRIKECEEQVSASSSRSSERVTNPTSKILRLSSLNGGTSMNLSQASSINQPLKMKAKTRLDGLRQSLDTVSEDESETAV